MKNFLIQDLAYIFYEYYENLLFYFVVNDNFIRIN